jgi:glycerol-3-phosphate acyltransferase PlsY
MDSTTVTTILGCIVVGYLLGNISTAYFVGKLYGIDIRKEGSGNLGSTNALRTLGKKAGAMTFAGDIAKCLIPICIIRLVLFTENPELAIVFAMWYGLGCVLGHNYPFWLHFKGGKGIAVTSAVVLGIAHWPLILGGLSLFILIVAVTRYVSLGSLVVAFYLVINTLAWHMDSPYFVHMLCVSFVFAFFAFFQHRANIARLLNGTEHKIGEKKA